MIHLYNVLSKEDKKELIAARQAKANNRGNWRAVERNNNDISTMTSAEYHTVNELMIDDSVAN